MTKFASGKFSTAVCDRCGFRYEYLKFRSEPGTKWRVCSVCNDRQWNLVTHPQNKIPPITSDPQGLEFTRPEPASVAGPDPAPVTPWTPGDSAGD